MISVTFTADNYIELRKDIAQFMGSSGLLNNANNGPNYAPGDGVMLTAADPYPLGNAHVKATTLTYTEADQAEARTFINELAQIESLATAPLAPAPTAEETALTPAETQTEQPTDSASDASPPSNDIDPDVVRATTLRLASLKGRDAVMEVLKPYNVARSSEVPRDLWPQLIADLEAAQNG